MKTSTAVLVLSLVVLTGLVAGAEPPAAAGAAGPRAATDWPQIGGPNGGFWVSDPNLRDDWTGTEAKVAWRAKLTAPPSAKGVAIAKGLVYVVDLDAAGKEAILRVLGLDDGQERWTFRWALKKGELRKVNSFRGSVPAVADDLVYVIGDTEVGVEPGPKPGCIRAIDLKQHQQVWDMDPATKGWEVQQGASPIIVDDLVVFVANGQLSTDKKDRKGNQLLVALDCHSGELRWVAQAPENHGGWMIHAPQEAMIGGVRQIVMHHTGGVTGFSLDGKPLWTWTDYQRWSLRTCPSVSPAARIFVASGHEGSSALLRVTREGDAWTCKTIYVDGRDGKYQSYKDSPFPGGTPHLVTGNGFINSGAWWDNALYVGGDRGLHCTLADGAISWYSSQRALPANDSIGHHSVIAVNGRILTLETVKGKGESLVIVKADSKARTQLAAIPVHQSRSNVELAYADGRVISVSPLDGEVVCVDLGAKQP